MDTEQSLINFAYEVRQEVLSRADDENNAAFRLDAFTDYMINQLKETGELEDGFPVYFSARGMEVNGYNFDEDEGTLYLFASIYTQSIPPQNITRTNVETAFKRMAAFYQKATEGLYRQLEETSVAYDMALHIYERRNDIMTLRLYLFTDGVCSIDDTPISEIKGIQTTCSIWDIRRLFRSLNSGQRSEPIHIDFLEKFGEAIPCLMDAEQEGSYSVYLAIIPGKVLDLLYGEYGARLMELNVRSYLQAKGKVNKGIRTTILKQPERFLAYNNGISATASEIELMRQSDGGLAIKSLRGLQIVNGGQTTASIYYASRKDKANVSRIGVQAKITVVDPIELDELVPLISRYANSQNKVSEADFSANDKYHVILEDLSRSVWAPPIAGTQKLTHWFYERARGQYTDALARAGTPAKQKNFKETNPVNQKFSKTDLAKYELTWNRQPHIVSSGAQKCFLQFTSHIKRSEQIEVDKVYYQRLITKAILFHRAEKLIGKINFGGYRANIVTYTLAYISHVKGEFIDLDRIWLMQDIGPGFQEAIELVAHRVYGIVANPPGGKNVTEWCKRPECWEQIKAMQITLPTGFLQEMQQLKQENASPTTVTIDVDEQKIIEMAAKIDAAVWDRLTAWSRDSGNLSATQRTHANELEQKKLAGKKPSYPLAMKGLRMLKEAKQLGFKVEMAAVHAE